MGRDKDRRRAAADARIFAREWMPRIRKRVSDAVQLVPDDPELVALIATGAITVEQCEKAQRLGAVCYSPSQRRFINLAEAGEGETPDIE